MNPKQIEEFFHLTPVQKYVLRQSEQSAPSTQLAQFNCQLEGPLDVSAFERAWQRVTNHQPGLRTTFVSGDLKEPVQVVNRNVGVELEKQDWRNLSDADQARRLAELLQADRQTRFVLKTPPLWRMTLIRCDEERYHFIWTYHELLFDERSLPLLFNEAMRCYDAILHAQKIPLPMPSSFRKYVDWVKKKDAAATEQFWRTTLQGFRTPTPLTRTLPEMTVQLAADKARTLNALAAQHAIAPQVLAYGAWALLLSRLNRQTDVVFGIQISGRSPQFHASDRIIGHVRNTIPMRVRIAPDTMVVDWVTDLQKQWEELQQYGHVSLAQIHGWSDVAASQLLFESVIVVDVADPATGLDREVGGLRIQYDSLISPNHFPLAVMVKENGAWELTGDAHVVPLRYLLQQFALTPQHRLAEIVLPSEQIHPTILTADSNAFEPPPTPDTWFPPEEEEQGWVAWIKDETCVHELFEERVAQTPDAVAVRLQGHSLTYQELNARANQLARYLRKLNVVPSIPVGLCFAPSVEGLVAMLGVLKAGGAYLPLDAASSADEVQQIITDSATSIVLTQARLELKFRTIPVHCIVLCLDSDWAIIAEEETENLACQISDEHPACFLVEDEAVITHARLAKAVGSAQDWFRFEPNNPWHLFRTLPPPEPEPVSKAEALNEMNSGMDWFDLTPEPMLETAPEATFTLSADPDFELDVATVTEPTLPSEFELDLPFEPDSIPTQSVKNGTAPPVTAEQNANVIVADQAVKPSTLTPIQQWFFAQHPLEPQHWNVSLLAEIREALDHPTLQQALELVVAQHAALGWRFANTDGQWQLIEAVETAALPFESVDFSAKWARSQRKAIEETAEKLQTSLHLTDGPLWRAAYFDLGADRSHRLLIVAHHLIADESSLGIFLRDWLTTYWQLRRDQRVTLSPPAAAYQEWLQAVTTAVKPDEVAYWQRLDDVSWEDLPTDHPDGANTYGQVDRVVVSLNSKETESLLHQLPQAAEADVNEIVLTALTLALAQWTGKQGALLEVERETRQVGELDFSNTMGWFATKFPIWLEVENLADVAFALDAVKAQLRTIPRQGIGYGLLSHHPAAERDTDLRNLPAPKVSFKYLTLPAENPSWRIAPESVGTEHHPHNERNILIAVTGAMNLSMLEFRWEYARQQFEQKNIGLLVNGFIEELRKLIAHFAAS
jgi:non-ribosomal peptide synthase protein (TIGR01720 family)